MIDEGIVIPKHVETSRTAAPPEQEKNECGRVTEWGNEPKFQIGYFVLTFAIYVVLTFCIRVLLRSPPTPAAPHPGGHLWVTGTFSAFSTKRVQFPVGISFARVNDPADKLISYDEAVSIPNLTLPPPIPLPFQLQALGNLFSWKWTDLSTGRELPNYIRLPPLETLILPK